MRPAITPSRGQHLRAAASPVPTTGLRHRPPRGPPALQRPGLEGAQPEKEALLDAPPTRVASVSFGRSRLSLIGGPTASRHSGYRFHGAFRSGGRRRGPSVTNGGWLRATEVARASCPSRAEVASVAGRLDVPGPGNHSRASLAASVSHPHPRGDTPGRDQGCSPTGRHLSET
jgi:hypothetical protein